MEMKTTHPAEAIDVEDAAVRFWWSLTGGSHWDDLMVRLKPELAGSGTEHASYTMDACIDDGLTDEEDLDPQSERGREVLRRWCDARAARCREVLRGLDIVDGHVRAHRLIACGPEELRADLGVFWSHAFDEWPDPVAPWAEGGREARTLVVEALIPIEAIDWQVSCMALMDWYCGDSESELRVLPAHPVRFVSCRDLETDEPMIVPDLTWRT